MPVDIVEVDINSQTSAVSKPTYNDIVLVGSSSTAPSQGYNSPMWYSDPTEVAADTSDGSDVHIASRVLDSMGVEEWLVVVLEEISVTGEVLGDSDTTSTSSGTVLNTPISGRASVSVSVDGTDKNVVHKTVSPPDANTSPASGEAFVNPDTGEVVTDSSTSGSGSGIEVDYAHLSWSDAFTNLQTYGGDVGVLADTRADKSYIGDLDELVSWGAGHGMAVIAAGPNGNDYASDDAARQAYHKIAGYTQSGNYAMIAHKSSDDASAYVAGQLGVEPTWHDMLYYGDGYNGLSTGFYRDSLVGEPAQAGTFEGGDSENQTGPVNPFISVQGTTVLSNSLTTAGSSSDYQYLDVWRTEQFIVNEAERSLTTLSLQQDKIPFDSEGQTLIEDALKGSLMQYRGSNQPFSSLTVQVPQFSSLTEQQRANRVWGPIQIEGRLSGNAHKFSVEFSTKV